MHRGHKIEEGTLILKEIKINAFLNFGPLIPYSPHPGLCPGPNPSLGIADLFPQLLGELPEHRRQSSTILRNGFC